MKLSFLFVFAICWQNTESQKLSVSRRLQPTQEIKPSDFEKAGFSPGFEIQGEERQEIIKVSTPENCQTECLIRKSNCHAWTFLDQRCFLKYGPKLCENTPSKSGSTPLRSRSSIIKQANPEAISGLTCSSTSTTPIPPTAGGNDPQNGSGTVSVGSLNGPTTTWRICWVFRNGRWRPVWC